MILKKVQELLTLNFTAPVVVVVAIHAAKIRAVEVEPGAFYASDPRKRKR